MARVRNYHSLNFKVRMALRRFRTRALKTLIALLETDSQPASSY